MIINAGCKVWIFLKKKKSFPNPLQKKKIPALRPDLPEGMGKRKRVIRLGLFRNHGQSSWPGFRPGVSLRISLRSIPRPHPEPGVLTGCQRDWPGFLRISARCARLNLPFPGIHPQALDRTVPPLAKSPQALPAERPPTGASRPASPGT